MSTRSAVYRLYDAEDNLLYVGSTQSLAQRYQTHARDKSWWADVARKAEVWYETREDAYRAERIAIREDCPRYNVQDRIPDLTDSELELLDAGIELRQCREKTAAILAEAKQAAIDANAAGWPMREIARHLKVDRMTVRKWIRTVRKPEPPPQMSDKFEVWTDRLGDLPPLQREPEKCGQCGDDLVLRHVCENGPPFPVPGWLEREREQWQDVINNWAAAYAKQARELDALKTNLA